MTFPLISYFLDVSMDDNYSLLFTTIHATTLDKVEKYVMV